MSDKKIFRVALVGCGTISKNHLTALSELDNIRVVALCDTDRSRAENRRREFSLDCEIFSSYEEMLDGARPDAVHICTPHYLHCPMALAALARDIHVFLEKPMCMKEEEISLLLEAERKSRAKITVCFQNRTNPSTVEAMKIAEEDGGVLSAYAAVFWYRSAAYYTESGWRGRFATEGGGVMINQAIHCLDLLCLFLGRPLSVCATTANHHLKGVIEVEDACEGVIGFENGRQANFYATTAFPGGDSTELLLVTKHHKIEIRSPYLYLDGVQVCEESLTNCDYVGKECYGNGHRTLIRAFYRALADGTEMPVTPDSAKDAVRILLAAYRSHDKTVTL